MRLVSEPRSGEPTRMSSPRARPRRFGASRNEMTTSRDSASQKMAIIRARNRSESRVTCGEGSVHQLSACRTPRHAAADTRNMLLRRCTCTSVRRGTETAACALAAIIIPTRHSDGL